MLMVLLLFQMPHGQQFGNQYGMPGQRHPGPMGPGPGPMPSKPGLGNMYGGQRRPGPYPSHHQIQQKRHFPNGAPVSPYSIHYSYRPKITLIPLYLLGTIGLLWLASVPQLRICYHSGSFVKRTAMEIFYEDFPISTHNTAITLVSYYCCEKKMLITVAISVCLT